jgi:mono/diheme cytochrome c family protein
LSHQDHTDLPVSADTSPRVPVTNALHSVFPWKTFAVCIACCLAFVLLTASAHPQALHYTKRPDPRSGEQVYKNGCIACHGSEGKGASEVNTVFTRPSTFPDFTDCKGTSAESNPTWKDVIVHGGRARGLSPIMPAFGKLLTPAQIDDAIAYLRSFCTNPHWPRGELNLPRALVTEKAFPEDEVVVSTALNASGAPGFTTDVIHEQRFGVKNQIEIDVPVNFQDQDHNWNQGIGDITFGLKRVIYSNLEKGSIFSLQGGIQAPTGSLSRGFGSGTTTFEPFAAFDQLFPSNTFVQLQAGADLRVHSDVTPSSVFWRAAVGQAFAGSHGLGRLFSPMIEAVAARDLKEGASADWDLVPQMQVTVSRRQHIRADVGVRTPVSNTPGRTSQVVFYVLWDWADGKLWEGWK